MVDFPRWEDKDLTGWISRTKRYFRYHKTPEASMHPCQGVGVTAFAADTAPAGGSFMGATPAGVLASDRPCGLAMAWLQAVQAAADSPFAGGLGRGQATYSRGRPPL
ncbi:hypothetical protein BHM03_00048894 [Ensete ventricosum]|nr:hypothetical protein BHM03_00048894 [Ensete ventricosum]